MEKQKAEKIACPKHPEKEISLYCVECHKFLCLKCHVTHGAEYPKHDPKKLKEVARVFKDFVKKDQEKGFKNEFASLLILKWGHAIKKMLQSIEFYLFNTLSEYNKELMKNWNKKEETSKKMQELMSKKDYVNIIKYGESYVKTIDDEQKALQEKGSQLNNKIDKAKKILEELIKPMNEIITKNKSEKDLNSNEDQNIIHENELIKNDSKPYDFEKRPLKMLVCKGCGENCKSYENLITFGLLSYHKTCLRAEILQELKEGKFNGFAYKENGNEKVMKLKDFVAQGILKPSDIPADNCTMCLNSIIQKLDLIIVDGCNHAFHKKCYQEIDYKNPCVTCKLQRMNELISKSNEIIEPEILCKICGKTNTQKNMLRINCCLSFFCMDCLRKKFACKNFTECSCPVCKKLMLESEYKKILWAHICDKCKCKPTYTNKLVQIRCGHWFHKLKCIEKSYKEQCCEICNEPFIFA